MTQTNQAIVHSSEFAAVIADELEILIDTDEGRGPVIGLKVSPVDAPPFIMPLTFPCAKELALSIFKTLLFADPELFGNEIAALDGS
jgi:hypothetical protein